MHIKFLKISRIFFLIHVFLLAAIFWLKLKKFNKDLRNQPPSRFIRYECITEGYPRGACGGWGKTLNIFENNFILIKFLKIY